jgi:AcrR family transcriptional regulator
MSETRPYKKKARARSEEATGKAILDAAYREFSQELFDRVTLNRIAELSGVTVQTVIRRFSSKEELFRQLALREEKRILEQRNVPEDEGLESAIHALIQHYERDGELVLNFLAQENQIEQIKEITDRGRKIHMKWVETYCRHLLEGETEEERTQNRFAAIAATDLGTWKLLRKDYGMEPDKIAGVMMKLLNGISGES